MQWVERKVGITASGLVLLALITIGWASARLTGSRALYLLAYAGLAVIAGSYVVSRRRPAVAGLRSQLPTRVREGQQILVEVALSAKRRATTLVVEEAMANFLGPPIIHPVAVVSPGHPVTHQYNLVPRLRGVYRLGPLTLSWSDPFGLTRGQMQLAEAVDLIVHPTTELIFDRPLTRQWEDPPIRPPKTKPWPTGFEFYGMRDYVPGDDLRRVVWRAAARTGKLMVRESEQGVTDKVVIVMNTWKEVHKPGTPSETFETAVRACASFASRHIKDGFSVTMEANDRQLARNLRGPRARITMLDELSRIQPGEAPFTPAIDRLLTGQRGGAHYIVITPYIGTQVATRLRLITEAGASVLVAIILWEDSDPMTERRAIEMGAQVVHLKPGRAMAGVTGHSLGAGINSHAGSAGVA